MHDTEATKQPILILLSIESDLLRSIDMSSIINEFALKNRVSTTFTKPLQNEILIKDMLHHMYILHAEHINSLIIVKLLLLL